MYALPCKDYLREAREQENEDYEPRHHVLHRDLYDGVDEQPHVPVIDRDTPSTGKHRIVRRSRRNHAQTYKGTGSNSLVLLATLEQ